MLSGYLSMLCTNSGDPGMDTCTYQIVLEEPAFVPGQTLCVSSAVPLGYKDRQLRPGRPSINSVMFRVQIWFYATKHMFHEFQNSWKICC